MTVVAAWSFTVLAALVVAFQLALVAGAPWGRLTQGGVHPGRLPAPARAAAAASAVVLAGLALLVLARAGLLGDAALAASTPWAWAAVVVSALTTLANAASRSRSERALFLPVALGMLATSLIVLLA
jgi:hypothetical protein